MNHSVKRWIRKFYQITPTTLCVLSVGALLSACSIEKPAPEVAEAPVDAAYVAPPTTSSTLFAARVETEYDQEPVKILEKSCEIANGSALGTTLNCTANIPEGRLYYSKLHLTFGAASVSTCELMFIYPYYYRASTSAAFQPTWSVSEVDCTAFPLPADCFSGVGTEVKDFPRAVGYYFKPSDSLYRHFEFSSAHSKWRGTNRWSCNTLTDRTMNISLSGDGFIANSMADYQFLCTDRWLQPRYTINLTITDEDEEGGDPDPDDPDSNHRADWNSAVD